MEAEDAGSGKEDEPEQEVTSEQEEGDSADASTVQGPNQLSTTRLQRNYAEKCRRDKLNQCINELSSLVPIVSFSPKKLDKTSVLRLAATYIRLHNVIFGPTRQDGSRRSTDAPPRMMEYLPQYIASVNWTDNLLEDMDGMMMIVNGAGRIIYISHNVEKLLGHTQIELMGQSLYTLTCLEDYKELKRNLAPDGDFSNLEDLEIEDNSTDYPSAPPTPALPSPSGADVKQRRTFFIRLRLRGQSRSDQPQYELVHVVGHLRVPSRSSQPSTSQQTPNLNDIVLVSVVKQFKERRITTLSLTEATREEFITRHTLDGRIIYTDHRISIVSGYMAEEVCGVPGFQFMHKDEMRWTMVGLRQMFYRGASYGISCYRLLTKSGSFIYIKTCGYLETVENSDSFQSLICINSLADPKEGEELIMKMKELYAPMIKNRQDTSMERLTSNLSIDTKVADSKGETEDKQMVEDAISQLISVVPNTPQQSSCSIHSPTLSKMSDAESQFAKATLAAKVLPPLSIQVKKIGIVPPVIRGPGSSATGSLSPQSSLHSPPPKASPPPPPPPVCPQQNRPSVLRVAHRQGDHLVPPPDCVSVLKIKKMRVDEAGQDVVTSLSTTPHIVGVVVSPSGSKRKSDDSCEWALQSSPIQPPPPLSPHYQLETVEQLLSSVNGPLLFDEASPPPLVSNLEDIGLTDVYSLWDQPEVLETSHRNLDSTLQVQGSQIHDIEQELELMPVEHSSGHVFNSKLTELQKEHMKQRLILRTLQQDHQNMQQMGVCNSQQNIGV